MVPIISWTLRQAVRDCTKKSHTFYISWDSLSAVKENRIKFIFVS